MAAICGSGKRFSDSWPHSIKIVFADHVVLCYTKGSVVHCQASVITGRRRKGKGSVGPFRYNYYCEPTKDPALIRDMAFIFVIMLFSPATNETRRLYESSRNSRQYGMFIPSAGQPSCCETHKWEENRASFSHKTEYQCSNTDLLF